MPGAEDYAVAFGPNLIQDDQLLPFNYLLTCNQDVPNIRVRRTMCIWSYIVMYIYIYTDGHVPVYIYIYIYIYTHLCIYLLFVIREREIERETDTETKSSSFHEGILISLGRWKLPGTLLPDSAKPNLSFAM